MYQLLDKYRKWLVQFVYLVFKLDLQASKGYDGNEVDLPSRSFGAAATIIWIQTIDHGDPGNAKNDKAENTDYTMAKLKIMFGDKYLPIIWRQRGDYEITRLELHKLMTKLKKIWNLPNFY